MKHYWKLKSWTEIWRNLCRPLVEVDQKSPVFQSQTFDLLQWNVFRNHWACSCWMVTRSKTQIELLAKENTGKLSYLSCVRVLSIFHVYSMDQLVEESFLSLNLSISLLSIRIRIKKWYLVERASFKLIWTSSRDPNKIAIVGFGRYKTMCVLDCLSSFLCLIWS